MLAQQCKEEDCFLTLDWKALYQELPEAFNAMGKMQGLSGIAYVEYLELSKSIGNDKAWDEITKKYPSHEEYWKEREQFAAEAEKKGFENLNKNLLRVDSIISTRFPEGEITTADWKKLYEEFPKEINIYFNHQGFSSFEDFIELLTIKEEDANKLDSMIIAANEDKSIQFDVYISTLDLLKKNNQEDELSVASILKSNAQKLDDSGEFIHGLTGGMRDAFISYLIDRIRINKIESGRLYDHVLATKGFLLDFRRKFVRSIHLNGNNEQKKLLQQWQKEINVLNQLFIQHQNDVYSIRGVFNQQTHIVGKLAKSLVNDVSQYKATTYHWKQVHNQLKQGEAAIEIIKYHCYKTKYEKDIHYAALILRWDKTQPILVILKNGNDLENKWFNQFQDEIINYSTNNQLYSVFWEPIQNELDGVQKIFLSPDGVYHKLNINMLSIPDEKRLFLIDKISVDFVVSTRSLVDWGRVNDNDSVHAKNALIVGYPDYDFKLTENSKINSRYNQLPQAEVEINTIESLLNKYSYQTRILSGIQARESALLQFNPSILHIASHSFFKDFTPSVSQLYNAGTSDIHPLDLNITAMGRGYNRISFDPFFRSGIALTGANSISEQPNSSLSEDGILFGYEIKNWNLTNTELVVLSSCLTGKGDVNQGIGVYGLQFAFFLAGAECVMMNLWEVDDSISRIFFERFYENWLEKKMSKREAFRQAQISLKNSGYPPVYWWGGFMMVSI